MALVVLSAVLSIILGSCVWLAIGDKFPWGEDDKWPASNNIFIYAVVLLLPVYLTIFTVF